MMSVKHSVAHRFKRKEPGKWEPPDSSVSLRTEGTTVQLCGDGDVAEKWIHGHHAAGQKASGEHWTGSEHTALMVRKRKIAYPVAQIDDYVKHIFREHNQEADNLAKSRSQSRE